MHGGDSVAVWGVGVDEKRQHQADKRPCQADAEGAFKSRQRKKLADTTGVVNDVAGQHLEGSDTQKGCRIENAGGQAQVLGWRGFPDDSPDRADEPADDNPHHEKEHCESDDTQPVENKQDGQPAQGVDGRDDRQRVGFVQRETIRQPAEKGSTEGWPFPW